MARMWNVEWIESVPQLKNGDADLDSADERVRRFGTQREAEKFARSIVVGKPFEVAYITPVRQISRAEYVNMTSDADHGTAWWHEGREYWCQDGERYEIEPRSEQPDQ